VPGLNSLQPWRNAGIHKFAVCDHRGRNSHLPEGLGSHPRHGNQSQFFNGIPLPLETNPYQHPTQPGARPVQNLRAISSSLKHSSSKPIRPAEAPEFNIRDGFSQWCNGEHVQGRMCVPRGKHRSKFSNLGGCRAAQQYNQRIRQSAQHLP